MHEKKFYKAKRVLKPTPNQGGGWTEHYIIEVDTHDSHGKPYHDLKTRAEEAFNAAFYQNPVELTEIDEKDVPKKKRLDRKISLQGRAVYLIENE